MASHIEVGTATIVITALAEQALISNASVDGHRTYSGGVTDCPTAKVVSDNGRRTSRAAIIAILTGAIAILIGRVTRIGVISSGG